MKLFYTPPNWLRWVLLLPVSLSVGLVVIGVITPFLEPTQRRGGPDDPTLPIWICLFLSGTLSQYLTSWTAYTCAPKAKPIVLRVVSIIAILILSVIFLDYYTSSYQSISGRILQVQAIGAIVGSLYAWFTIRPPSTE